MWSTLKRSSGAKLGHNKPDIPAIDTNKERKFHFRFVERRFLAAIREIKLDVTWSFVKRQTAKMRLLSSVFSSLNSTVEIFVFVANSRRHFSIFI